MKNRISKIILFFLLFFSFSWILDKYDEQLSEFNGKLTNLLRGNDFKIRTFDKNGIPISNFGRLGVKATSPFYVVHYGLIYSSKLKHPLKYDYLWKYDNSTKYWNVPPKKELITKRNFFNTVEWVVNHVKKDKYGHLHLFYNFDWYYKHLSGNKLKAPWYSGLTEGMALTLLTRAYVLTNNLKYKKVAYALYNSIIDSRKNGGCTIILRDGEKWIEEYVAQNLPDNKQPRVLNGMIYASFGVYFFEKTFNINPKKSIEYFHSIRNNIDRFDLGYWTAYDLIGTVADYKYHHVHLGLLKDLYFLTKDKYYEKLYQKWSQYSTSFLKRHFVFTTPTVNSVMTLLEYLFFIILLEYIILSFWRRIK